MYNRKIQLNLWWTFKLSWTFHGLQKYYHRPFAYQNISSMRPCAKSKWPRCVTWLTGCSAKAQFKKKNPFACLIHCWMLFIATILWRMAKCILKTTQTIGSKIKHWRLMQWRTTVTGVKFWWKRKSVLHYIVCGCWSWNISTHIMFDRGIFRSL